MAAAWAVALTLQGVVFEYLRPDCPQRGLAWRRRTNRQRSYQLRGQILRHVRDLAWREDILVVERNPACRCHHVAEGSRQAGSAIPAAYPADTVAGRATRTGPRL